jgi:hypothetical protein
LVGQVQTAYEIDEQRRISHVTTLRTM